MKHGAMKMKFSNDKFHVGILPAQEMKEVYHEIRLSTLRPTH
jgi:hypothetical protein